MIGNIRDDRTDPSQPTCDAVVRPSVFEDTDRADGFGGRDQTNDDPLFFVVLILQATTVRQALLSAEEDFAFPITVRFYDAGTFPDLLADPVIRRALSVRRFGSGSRPSDALPTFPTLKRYRT